MSKLVLSGLLKGSFIPKIEFRDLLDIVRYPKKVVERIAPEKNRIIQILEDPKGKLSSVLSNVDGVVGNRIIETLIDGKSEVDQLISLYHGKMKASKKEFGLALEGYLRPHHSQMLKIIKKSITNKEELLENIDL